MITLYTRDPSLSRKMSPPSIAQNCGEVLRELSLAHAWANSLPVVEISRYFSLSGMDLAAGEGVECNPHTFAVYPPAH
jgi:hypothetical protein